MKKLIREPLFHFLVLGVAIFAAYNLIAERSVDEPGNIVITEGQVAALEVGFARSMQRPPTREELEGLIRDRVQEEVYFREALALGLDKEDTIVRRRLRQKMEFITDDVAALGEPTDEELTNYLKAHPDLFHAERRFTFSHVYLSPDRRGENLTRDTRQLLAQLQQVGDKADVSELGDSFMLGQTFQSLPASEVVKLFGEKFAAKMGDFPPGQWQGPVESGYGMHLLLVSERTEGRLPALAEVREAVRAEWANSRRSEVNEKFYQELLKRYVVTIERPKPGEEKLITEARLK